MDELQEIGISRKQTGIRFGYTVLYLIILEVLKIVIQVTVLFQFVYLFVTKQYSEPLRKFSNKVATYAYRLIRYATLNENYRPFPFGEFPAEMERAENLDSTPSNWS